jgi:hypothetical protein
VRGGEEGALRLFSFPPGARRNGGRKVFENRDGLREKPQEGGKISKEIALASVCGAGRLKAPEGRSCTDRSLGENKQTEGKVLREEKHQEGHGACRRLNRGGWKRTDLQEGKNPWGDDRDGRIDAVRKRVKSREGRGLRKQHRPSSEGNPLKVKSLERSLP